MKAREELELLEIEECPECHCNIGDDWEYKDFSNKNIVICPQCTEEINLEEYRNNIWLRPCDKHFKEGFTRVMKGNFCYNCDKRNDVIKE